MLLLLAIYFLIGLGFAPAFVFWGYRRVDPSAKGVGLRLRLLWSPAAVVLWPIVMTLWFTNARAAALNNGAEG